MMRLLISVRSVGEALLAARGGADLIDLKEPDHGALGGLAVATIRSIVAALRLEGIALPISATIGDVPAHALDEIAARVDAVAACGVHYVKVGIERDAHARALLDRLAASAHKVVPVFIADRGLDTALIAHAASLTFPGLMIDTADKRAGSLLERVTAAELRGFVAAGRAARAMVGLAGALRVDDAPLLAALAPDFAGFRSAVCDGDRRAALDARRLRVLVEAMHAAQSR